MPRVGGRSDRARRLRRSWLQRSILTLNIVLVACSLLTAVVLQYGYNRASDIKRIELGRSLTPVATNVEVGERVINILLVGSDSSAGLDPTDPVQIGRQGERFGDVIIVAHIDERTRQIALLSFPRDLWVPLAGTNRSDRINRTFQLGGPAMLIDTIENTFDLPIHHYVNVDFAGFQGLVEAVGSVDIFFETPARDWNVNAKPEPRTQTGFLVSEAGCHALDPPTALAYVRSRYYQTQRPDGVWVTDPRSDFGRITRQQDFLRRLMFRAIDLGARNPFVLKDLIDAGLANVAIDDQLTPQLLLDVGSTYQRFDPDELQTYSVPAVDASIDENQILQTQWQDAEPILALMRGAGFDAPATVNLAVIGELGANTDTTGAKAALTDHLVNSEYVVESHMVSEVSGGVAIHHGPDGHAAAAQVAASIKSVLGDLGYDDESALSIVQVEDLNGRSIQVRVGDLDPAASIPAGSEDVAEGSDPTVAVPSNSAQPKTQTSQNRNEMLTSTTVGAMVDVDAAPTISASTSTLVGSKADKQVSTGDVPAAAEATCHT